MDDRITAWWAAAGDLVLGAVCPGCGAAGLGVCRGCRTTLAATRPGRRAPDPVPADFPVLVSHGPYDDPYRSMITAHKEEGALLLAPVLGGLLAAAVDALLVEVGVSGLPVRLVPMPSSTRSVRRRGYDATTTVARHAAARLRRRGQPAAVARLLAQTRTVRDQAGLGAAERARNLAGGLRLRRGPGLAPTTGWLVLVDDVVTTGATLAEAARVLGATGARVLGGASIAATVRRSRGTD